MEIEKDGYITADRDLISKPLEYGRHGGVLTQYAFPSKDCKYPNCEECRQYVLHGGERFCSVPMVVSKQTYIATERKIAGLSREISELKELVFDEILSPEKGNMSREILGV